MKEHIELYTDFYTPAKASAAVRGEVRKSLTNLKELYMGLGLHRPRIYYAEHIEENGVACYCAGSGDWPVIVLVASAFEDPDLDLSRAIESTIVHECLHAYLETLGLDCFDYEHPEDDIENLTRRYCDGLICVPEIMAELDKVADYLMRDEIDNCIEGAIARI